MFHYAVLKKGKELWRTTGLLPLLLSRSITNARSNKHPPVFELRNYEVPPGKLGDVMKSATVRVNVEMEMGAMLRGFWATEGILKHGLITTDLFALWEYESYNHRDEQLAKRITSDKWIASVKTMQPLVTTKSITLWKHFNFVPLLLEPRQTGGIFELRNYRFHPGMIPAWQKRYSAVFPKRTKYSSPIGMWFSEVGSLNEILHIWPYKSMEERAAVRASCAEDPEVSQSIADSMTFIQKMKNQILYPTPLSPIQ